MRAYAAQRRRTRTEIPAGGRRPLLTGRGYGHEWAAVWAW